MQAAHSNAIQLMHEHKTALKAVEAETRRRAIKCRAQWHQCTVHCTDTTTSISGPPVGKSSRLILILLGLLFNKLNTTSTYYAVRYVSWEYEPLWASLHACCSPQCTTLWVYNYTIQYNCAIQLHNATQHCIMPQFMPTAVANAAKNIDVVEQMSKTWKTWKHMIFDIVWYHTIWYHIILYEQYLIQKLSTKRRMW